MFPKDSVTDQVVTPDRVAAGGLEGRPGLVCALGSSLLAGAGSALLPDGFETAAGDPVAAVPGPDVSADGLEAEGVKGLSTWAVFSSGVEGLFDPDIK